MAISCHVYVGERSRNSKFSYVSPRSIYGETSNEGKESASTYPCRLLSGSVQVNGVEGVVLVVIQITGDPSAKRTAPPCSTHMQPGDVSHALIPQGERERLRKTPSSGSTTAWWWWRSVAILQGFAKHRGGGGGLGRGEGLRQNLGAAALPPPHIYRGKGEGGQPPQIQSEEGAAAKGGRSASQVKWRPSPLGFPPSHAHGPWGAGSPGPLRLGRPLTAHAAVLDVVEQFPDLRTPLESSGTFWKLPGTIPKKPNFFRNPNSNFPYINLYLRTIPELLVTSGISSGTPKNIR